MSKVDVIIPAYLPNERYISLLQRALKSLEQQTFKLLVNAVSNDVLRYFCFKTGLLRHAIGNDLLNAARNVFASVEELLDSHVVSQ